MKTFFDSLANLFDETSLLALVGGWFWILTAAYLGYYRKDSVPSAFPTLFSLVGVSAILTISFLFVDGIVSEVLQLLGISLFMLTPVLYILWLRRYATGGEYADSNSAR